MGLSPPGTGPYSLSLATPGFYLLALTFVLFLVMLFLLYSSHPGRRRGFEGYLDAAGVSLGFLVFSLVLVVALVAHDPHGNRTSYALYTTVVSGYWLAFAIPIVAVASSIEARSRRAIRWFLPSVGLAVAMFFAIFGYFYAALG